MKLPFSAPQTDPRLDLLPEDTAPAATAPKKNKKIWRLFLYALIFLVTGLSVFSTQILVSKQSSTSWLSSIPFFNQIKNFAESANPQLKGEDRDRINIVLLGMGGKNHDGAYLTDTIMLVSLEPSTKKVALVSIPRDLAVPIENMGWRKINAVNAYAEADKPGSGGLAVSQGLSKIMNMPIDYYIRVDFEGFINMIDDMGGINVYVDNTLDDYSYPIMGKEDAVPYESRFEHLHIEQGWQKMDGATALKFARSRHAYGAEGSDFARAKRQQKILEAAKNNLLSINTIFKPTMIADLLREASDHFSTNLQVWEIIKLWDGFKGVKKENVINKVLDNGPDSLLVDSVSDDGAYILSPRSGDFSEIQYFVNTIFSEEPRDLKTIVRDERAMVEVRNGTWVNGLASKAALDLEKLGFTIVRIGNNSSQPIEKTVIYDLSFGEKKKSLAILQNKTAASIAYSIPDWLTKEIGADLKNEKNPIKPDFILILGQNADKGNSGSLNRETAQ